MLVSENQARGWKLYRHELGFNLISEGEGLSCRLGLDGDPKNAEVRGLSAVKMECLNWARSFILMLVSEDQAKGWKLYRHDFGFHLTSEGIGGVSCRLNLDGIPWTAREKDFSDIEMERLNWARSFIASSKN